MNLHTLAKILFSVGICLTVYLFVSINEYSKDRFDEQEPNKGNVIEKAEINILDKNNISKITAEKLSRDRGGVSAENAHAEIAFENNTIKIDSKYANGTKEKCDFWDGVDIKFGNGDYMFSSSANVDFKKKIIKIPTHVKAVYSGMNILGDKCDFDLENSLVSFSGNVHIEGEELKAKCSSVDMIYLLSEKMRNRLRNSDDSRIVAYNEATPFETTGKKTKIKKAVLNKNVDIKYDYNGAYHLRVQDKLVFENAKITAYGNVIVDYENLKGESFSLKSNLIEARFDKNRKINKILCKNSFVFNSNDNIIRGQDGVWTSDKVIVNKDISVTSPNGVMEGQSGYYDIKLRKAFIKSPSGVFFKKGKK